MPKILKGRFPERQFGRQELHGVLAEVLDLPYKDPQVKQILRAIFQSITSAIRRGEPVVIPGFGRFFLAKRKPRRVPTLLLGGPYNFTKSSAGETIQGKTYVVFRPTRHLRAMLNMHNEQLTYHERASIRSWK